MFKTSIVEAFHPETGVGRPFSLLECGDWVNVIALTLTREVVLLRQYRAGTDQVCLEIPGGMIDPGEEPLIAAQRELAEETGYQAASWRALGEVRPNPAIQNNRLYTFLAEGATRAAAPTPDGGEVLAVETQPLTRCWEMLRSGAIDHALVLVAFGHLAFEQPSLRA